MASRKQRPNGSLDDDADESVARLAALSPRLADIAVAIHSGAMTRVEAAKGLLEVVDPSTLTSELVLEVLLATDAYAERSVLRARGTLDELTGLLATGYELLGLERFATQLDRIAALRAGMRRAVN